MKHAVRKFPAVWRASRLARRWYHARVDAYPDWSRALLADNRRWERARREAAGGPRVLLASSIGAYAHAVSLESALGVALTLRGAEVHVLLCDSDLPACAECEASLYPELDRFVADGPSRDLCRDCRWPAERVYRELGIRVHRYGDWLTADDRASAGVTARSLPVEAIRDFVEDGLQVGEHAYAGALRFFASGTLDGEPRGEAVLRRYLESALLTARASRRLMREVGFTAATVTHGIYVPWGIIGEAARHEGVRVVTWNVAYRKRRFIFSHDDTYHHTLMNEPVSHWEGEELKPSQERELMSYLASRREGLFDWIVFHRAEHQDTRALAAKVGVDLSRPVIGCLTNVSWDAQLHYPANAFPDMLTWFVETVRYFRRRPDLQLLVRVHPAEISGFPVSRQPILGELARHVPDVPPNVILVPPESAMSSYALMSLCNAAIIYGTKMGVELSSVGLPVIVAGEAWIRNKGITWDASTPEEYFALLDQLPFAEGMPDARVARARRYAYHFFFNRMIPLPFIEPKAGYPIYQLRLDRLDPLLPGATPGLDVICDGILQGQPFHLDERRASTASAPSV
ncbi:MAG: capsule biosynthesis protein [Vicinamibacterales bacterium]